MYQLIAIAGFHICRFIGPGGLREIALQPQGSTR